MRSTKGRNLTVRLPTALLRRLKEQSAVEGLSMNAYLERVLEKALGGNQNDAQRVAARRLLAQSKAGLYEMDLALNREQAHDRLVPIGKIKGKRQAGSLKGKLQVGSEFFERLLTDELSAWE